MNHKRIGFIGAIGLLCFALLLVGCDRAAPPIAEPTLAALPATTTLIPAPTAAATRPTPGATVAVASTVVATPTQPRPAATTVPTVVQPPPTPRPTATPSIVLPPTPTRVITGRTMTVKLFMIALNDNGAAGPKVGCGDSVVGVPQTLPFSNSPLTDTYKELLAQHDQTFGSSRRYNALYNSRLAVESVSLSGGKATVKLTGTFSLAGECDDPRVEAQLTQTALQYSTVKDVAIFINGKPLSSLLGGR